MNKKLIIIISIAVILAAIMIGCSKKELSESILRECKEGTYSFPSEYEQLMKESGYKVDYARVTVSYSMCNVKAVLKKPVEVMGTTTQSFNVMSCSMTCLEKYKDDSDVNGLERCCSFK